MTAEIDDRRRAGWRAPGLAAALLAAAALAAYGRTFSCPMMFDDFSSIPDNPSLRHLRTVLFPPPNITATSRPVLNLSLAANYAIGGTAVWSYHALNLLIHLGAGLTLYGIVRRTLAPRRGAAADWIAFAAALLWTVHPIQTESVTYIVQRAESLMGLFYLLTLYCFIRGAEPGGRRWLGLSWLACLLGMGTKEVMVSAPVIVLLYDRTFLAGSLGEAWRRRRGYYLGLASTWILLGLLVVSAGGNRGGHTTGVGAGAGWRAYALTQFPALCHYLRLSFWPHPLIFAYESFWIRHPFSVLPEAAAVLLLAAATLWALRRCPELGFLGFFFFAILAPTSLIPGTVQMIAEHRMYLALAPVMVLLVFAADRWLGSFARIGCCLLAAGWLAMTWRRNETYRSQVSLWSDTAAKQPDNEVAHASLAMAYAEVPGHVDDVIEQCQRALRLDPNDAKMHYFLGNAWCEKPGRLADAMSEYLEALRLDPKHSLAHNNLGNLLLKLGRPDAALAEYQEAVKTDPDNSEAHNNLAVLLSQKPGRFPDAIVEFKEVLRLKPDEPGGHFNLGVAWLNSPTPGGGREAIAQFEEALRLKPDFARAHFMLATALAQSPGRGAEARAQLQSALRLDPGNRDYLALQRRIASAQ